MIPTPFRRAVMAGRGDPGVADLHLGKGTNFGRRGAFLPPYDSQAALAAVAAVIGEVSRHFHPKASVSLGGKRMVQARTRATKPAAAG